MAATLLSDEIINAVSSLQCHEAKTRLDLLHDTVVQTLENINFKLVEKTNVILSQGNNETADYPLMAPFTHFLVAYGYFVLFLVGLVLVRALPLKKLDTIFNPLQLVFNIAMAIFSFWIAAETYFQAFVANDFSAVGNTVSTESQFLPIAKIIWVFYFAKMIEMIDTVFLILRGNRCRLTPYHFYRHLSMFTVFWIITYFCPGGDAVYPVLAYSAITSINYWYYASNCLGMSLGPFEHILTLANMAVYFGVAFHIAISLIVQNLALPCLAKWLLLLQALSLGFFSLLHLFRSIRCSARGCHKADVVVIKTKTE
eukprot:TRINITY_DN12823_c0_g1_i1.p1 TRINITY_DN12823_c0_g1~~TRINITY_DN12823_c0_g1_i1.p1  ORF type:complete len:313 (+),score=136.17 TRINITY_DN12823_c0_g1_i1:131-1069(+)